MARKVWRFGLTDAYWVMGVAGLEEWYLPLRGLAFLIVDARTSAPRFLYRICCEGRLARATLFPFGVAGGPRGWVGLTNCPTIVPNAGGRHGPWWQ